MNGAPILLVIRGFRFELKLHQIHIRQGKNKAHILCGCFCTNMLLLLVVVRLSLLLLNRWARVICKCIHCMVENFTARCLSLSGALVSLPYNFKRSHANVLFLLSRRPTYDFHTASEISENETTTIEYRFFFLSLSFKSPFCFKKKFWCHSNFKNEKKRVKKNVWRKSCLLRGANLSKVHEFHSC